MKTFEYATARSLASAPDLRGDNGRYLAGGIDLLGEMKEYIVSPDRLVNVKLLPGTREIASAGDGKTRIGANVTVAEIAAHPDLQTRLPGLTEAAAEVGSPQIRAVATLGGNLAQHSRCWYYRQRDLSCLKRGGSTCYAREGQNKYNAVLSGNPCISPVVSNLAIALAVLDAKVILWREGKEVAVSVADLYQDAWNNPLAQNSLKAGELITAVEIPQPAEGFRSVYLQVSEKSDFDWALVSCAASGKIDGGKFTQVRVALGAVAPIPYQVEAANSAIEGRPFDDASANAMADLLLKGATPLAHNGYKIPIAKALVRRTLMGLLK